MEDEEYLSLRIEKFSNHLRLFQLHVLSQMSDKADHFRQRHLEFALSGAVSCLRFSDHLFASHLSDKSGLCSLALN